MKRIRKNIRAKAFDNHTIVQEEKNGFGREFLRRHKISVVSPGALHGFTQMNVIEVIN